MSRLLTTGHQIDDNLVHTMRCRCGGTYIQYRGRPTCTTCGTFDTEDLMARQTKTQPEKPTWGETAEPPLSFESPESSNIVSASYNPANQSLLVVFKGNRTYLYPHVSREVWDAFATAESKGAYFASRIKGAGFVGGKV